MAYEVFDNKAARKFGSPQLRIRNGKIALNADAGDYLQSVGAKFVHILWDAQECKIAVQPVSKEDGRTFKLSIRKEKRGGTLSAQSFLNYIQWDSKVAVVVEANWNDAEGILEARLPKEHVGARLTLKKLASYALSKPKK
jgi:hypothetical protein